MIFLTPRFPDLVLQYTAPCRMIHSQILEVNQTGIGIHKHNGEIFNQCQIFSLRFIPFFEIRQREEGRGS